MNKKQTFVARFSDGQEITRQSFHPYTFAWRVIVPAGDGRDGWTATGFSSTKENAEKAAASEGTKLTSPRRFARSSPEIERFLEAQKARAAIVIRTRKMEVVAAGVRNA